MRSWNKACLASHSNCNKARTITRLPLRLLDVIPTDAEQSQVAAAIELQQYEKLSPEALPGTKIIPTSKMSPESPYLTLSHRWGNPPTILLSRSTIFLLGEDISQCLSETPGTAVFRHAIQLTRSLGFRYLWIDALCIMQDDEVEKMYEIMRMDEIYFNSALNIAATEATTDGLIFTRDLDRINPCRVIIKGTSGSPDVHLEAYSEDCFIKPSDGPLNNRGWVFQERYLSPRIIHSTRDQAYWECFGLVASETLPYGLPCALSRDTSAKEVPFETSPVMTPDQKKNAKFQWYELLEAYSETFLTFADDRLLAISAVAKRYCSHMGLDPLDYLAGMWKSDLPGSLLWSQQSIDSTRSHERASSARETTIAPSWSWASIVTDIQCGNQVMVDSLIVRSEVLETTIDRKSQNYFDGSNSCRLQLRGPLCKVIRRVIEGQPQLHIWNAPNHTKVTLRELEDSLPHESRDILVDWDTSRREISMFLNSTDVDVLQAPSMFCLLLVSSRAKDDAVQRRGIVLQRTELHGTYTRVGYFMTEYQDSDRNLELEDVFNSKLETLDPDDYLDVDSEGRYTIDLV